MTSSRFDPGSTSVRRQKAWTYPFYASMNGPGLKTLLFPSSFFLLPLFFFSFSVFPLFFCRYSPLSMEGFPVRICLWKSGRMILEKVWCLSIASSCWTIKSLSTSRQSIQSGLILLFVVGLWSCKLKLIWVVSLWVLFRFVDLIVSWVSRFACWFHCFHGSLDLLDCVVS